MQHWRHFTWNIGYFNLYMNQRIKVDSLDPVCGITTVYYQVSVIIWGHLNRFNKWGGLLWINKMVCLANLISIFICTQSTNLFLCFCNLEYPSIRIEELLRFWHKTILVMLVSEYERCPQSLVAICRNIVYMIFSGFILLPIAKSWWY